jgi:hypothetical protein
MKIPTIKLKMFWIKCQSKILKKVINFRLQIKHSMIWSSLTVQPLHTSSKTFTKTKKLIPTCATKSKWDCSAATW